MAEIVIELLEEIDVDHQKAHGILGFLSGTRKFVERAV
jgi:hypothetical protein